MHMCIYSYIYRERERNIINYVYIYIYMYRERDIEREVYNNILSAVCTYVLTYMCLVFVCICLVIELYTTITYILQ